MTARSPLTVLHIFSGDLWAGAEVMIFHLLKSLKSDASVQILALSLNDDTLASKLRDIGVKTWVIPEAENSFLQILLTAHRLFKGKGIDIIHSHGYKENILAFLLAKLLSVGRLIATLHGLPEPLRNGKGNSIKARLIHGLDYGILGRSFTRIVPVSLEMRERLIREYRFSAEKIRVIRNGIASPPDGLCPGHPDGGSFHIGTVGRLVPVKDFDLFLEVAAHMKGSDDGVKFSILGDGPLKEHLMRRARELGIEDSVEFLAARPDPFPYYRSLHLFLNTSLHEGIPLTLLEAMACGLPVVAPRVGGIPEVIEDGKQGLLVEQRTPADFARSCLEIVRSEGLRSAMGSSARERFADHFSSSRMASAYLDLYRESAAA
ncbi:MAG: glycosyltransferase family 4 protein [Candidatus Binatia bacterium]